MDTGQRIRERRTQIGLTQSELSEKTGIALRTIQRIENNEVNPSIHSKRVLREVLGIDLSEPEPRKKPYEFSLTISITDMDQFLTDLKALISKHWKILLLIIVIIWAITHYTDIKQGITDAWSGN